MLSAPPITTKLTINPALLASLPEGSAMDVTTVPTTAPITMISAFATSTL